MLTIDILGMQRVRMTQLNEIKLSALSSDFTWIVGNSDALTSSNRNMFEVNKLLNV